MYWHLYTSLNQNFYELSSFPFWISTRTQHHWTYQSTIRCSTTRNTPKNWSQQLLSMQAAKPWQASVRTRFRKSWYIIYQNNVLKVEQQRFWEYIYIYCKLSIFCPPLAKKICLIRGTCSFKLELPFNVQSTSSSFPGAQWFLFLMFGWYISKDNAKRCVYIYISVALSL